MDIVIQDPEMRSQNIFFELSMLRSVSLWAQKIKVKSQTYLSNPQLPPHLETKTWSGAT